MAMAPSRRRRPCHIHTMIVASTCVSRSTSRARPLARGGAGRRALVGDSGRHWRRRLRSRDRSAALQGVRGPSMLTEPRRRAALDERRLRRDRVDGKTPSVTLGNGHSNISLQARPSVPRVTCEWLVEAEGECHIRVPTSSVVSPPHCPAFFLQRACAHNYAHHAPLRGGLVGRACRLSAAESRSPRSCGRALRRLKLPRRLKVWHVLPRGRRPERRQVGALSRRADLIRLSRPLRHDAVCHWQWQPCPTPPIVTPHTPLAGNQFRGRWFLYGT